MSADQRDCPFLDAVMVQFAIGNVLLNLIEMCRYIKSEDFIAGLVLIALESPTEVSSCPMHFLNETPLTIHGVGGDAAVLGGDVLEHRRHYDNLVCFLGDQHLRQANAAVGVVAIHQHQGATTTVSILCVFACAVAYLSVRCHHLA